MKIIKNKDLNQLVELLKKDQVVAVPTDTVFGVCARYDHEVAQENLRDLKKRPVTKAFPLMCSDLEQVKGICEISQEEERIIQKFMPGPLTVILKKKSCVPDFVNGGQENLAIRLATSPELKEIIQGVGVPVYMTSANLSGEPAALTVEDVLNSIPKVEAILEGKVEYSVASSIIQWEQGEWKVLRQGPIQKEDLVK